MTDISDYQMGELPGRRPIRPDREILREQWRVKAQAHIEADDEYQRAKEARQIVLDRLVGELMAADPGMKSTTAERLARSSESYSQWLNTMHDLRRRASDLKLEAADADRKYWEIVSQDATDRAERKMVGYSR